MNTTAAFVHRPQSLAPTKKRLLVSMAVTVVVAALLLWWGVSWSYIAGFYAFWVLYDLIDFRIRKTCTPVSVAVEGEHIGITRLRFFARQPQAERYPLSDCLAVATFYDPNLGRLHTQLFLRQPYKAPITLDLHSSEMHKGRFLSKPLRQDSAPAAAFRQAMAHAAGLKDAGFIDDHSAGAMTKAVYKT